MLSKNFGAGFALPSIRFSSIGHARRNADSFSRGGMACPQMLKSEKMAAACEYSMSMLSEPTSD